MLVNVTTVIKLQYNKYLYTFLQTVLLESTGLESVCCSTTPQTKSFVQKPQHQIDTGLFLFSDKLIDSVGQIQSGFCEQRGKEIKVSVCFHVLRWLLD